MLKHLIIVPSLIFISLFGYMRYRINPPPIAKYEPIFWNQELRENSISWTLDSKMMYFYTFDGNSRLNYFQYSLEDEDIVRRSAIPSIAKSPIDTDLLDIFSVTRLFVSPNGEYSIYLKEQCEATNEEYYVPKGPYCLKNLHIYIHATQTIQTMNTVRIQTIASIYWSKDNEAFVIVSSGNGLISLSYFTFDRQNSQFVFGWQTGYDGFNKVLLSIASNGSSILLKRFYRNDLGIHVWTDIQNKFTGDLNTLPIILGYTPVAGATFLPNSNEEILAITQDGLLKYNIRTQESEILHPELNTSWIERAYFSPDARTVAIYSNNLDNFSWPCQLYVISLDGRFIVLLDLDHVCPFYG